MTNIILDNLVKDGIIKQYSLSIIDENGKFCDDEKGCRNTEQVKIMFNCGRTLSISSFCSGVMENTSLFIK
jgi:hypothetical protein